MLIDEQRKLCPRNGQSPFLTIRFHALRSIKVSADGCSAPIATLHFH